MVLRLLEKVEKTVYLLRSMILTSMAPAKHLLKSFSSELAEVKPSIGREQEHVHSPAVVGQGTISRFSFMVKVNALSTLS
jgi:hypothetical protein